MLTHHHEKIRKRNGKLAVFKLGKIARAINNAFKASNTYSYKEARKLSSEVVFKLTKDEIPTVEHVQDLVEDIRIPRGAGEAQDH